MNDSAVITVHTSDQRRRLLETIAMVAITGLLFLLSRLETRLFELSKSLSQNPEFLTTVVYFGLVNLNVVFILILSFLIFRNVARLVVERRRGILGSQLRTKLILTLVFFALAPTILMFYISSSFITTSFDTWFSAKVRDTMQQTREVGAQVYKQDQKRLESLARIALQRIDVLPPSDTGLLPRIDARRLKGFEHDYGLENIKVLDLQGRILWESGPEVQNASDLLAPSAGFTDAIERFINQPGTLSYGAVEADARRDTVKGYAPIYYQPSAALVGLVVTEEHFETQILRSIEAILKEFASLRPGAQLIRLSYLVLLVMMVLIIGFATTWLGFYVARAIVNPIQLLSEATREVAHGNYNVQLPPASNDETGMLVQAFGRMIVDLKDHQEKNAHFTQQLEASHEELRRRHHYMEVLLKNITAGVISVDAQEKITSFNSAAERLLGIKASSWIGKPIRLALNEDLSKMLWDPISESISREGTYNGEIKIGSPVRETLLLTTAIRIYDDARADMGVVVVFDDATEKAQAQRVAAWREVARRIAHEIKNPITPIKLSAERLLRRYGQQFTGDDQKIFVSCISTILSQVDSLRDLVNEFSEFSRMPAVKTKLTALNPLLRSAAQFYAMSYPDIEFETSGLTEEIPDLYLDKDQFSRALTNIVGNSVAALQGTPGEKKVIFKSYLTEDHRAIRIDIIDTGCGIPEANKEKVFDPYFSTKKDGTGLGLAIVQQIVNDHGGHIRILDYPPRGTQFQLDIPVETS